MSEPAATVGWLPRTADELFGEGATAEDAYGLLTVDVPADVWIAALTVARDELGCGYFDWLSAVDEPGTGFHVCAHLAALPTPGTGEPLRRLLLRTTVPHEAPTLPTATDVYAGANWHERETHEMFGVAFPGHPHLAPLLLPDSFEGHPLRKDFVLAARVAKAWPGAKEPGESGHGGPKRRQMLPPGVPDPNEWGPLKGQLPPAPARAARSRTASTDRPRRARSASAGSASQRSPKPETAPEAEGAAPKPEAAPRTEAARKPEAAPETEAARRTEAAPKPEASSANEPSTKNPRPSSTGDAPWHQAAPGDGEDVGTNASGTAEEGEPQPATSTDEAQPAVRETAGETGTGGGTDTARETDEARDKGEARETDEARDKGEARGKGGPREAREPREREGEED